MIEKKIFLFHEKGKENKKYVEEAFKSRGIIAKVEAPQVSSATEIPRGFDVYMLQLSEIREDYVEALRKEQPNSLVCSFFIGPEFKLPSYLDKIFDDLFFNWEEMYDTISKQLKIMEREK